MLEESVLARWRPAHVRGLWVVYWAALFGLMHTPREHLPDVSFSSLATAVHVTGYALLGLLGAACAQRSGARISIAWYRRWLLIYAAYAAVDEMTQALAIVNRSASVSDWLADMIGIVLSFAVLHWSCIRSRSAGGPR